MSVPIGTLIHWLGKGTSEDHLDLPNGYLLCNGSTHLRSAYSELASLLQVLDPRLIINDSQFRTPDLRSFFLRCAEIGRPILSEQPQSVQKHRHPLHTPNWAVPDVNAVALYNEAYITYGDRQQGGRPQAAVVMQGDQSAHRNNFKVVAMESDSSEETRPRNVAVYILIRASTTPEDP